MSAHPSAAPVDWRRVGALSTSFSLHGVAIALALTALTAPLVLPTRNVDRSPPAIIADWVDPPPIDAPPPPVEPIVPTVSAVAPTPTRTIALQTPLPVVADADLAAPTIVAVDAQVTADPIVDSQPAADTTRGAVAYDNVRAPRYPIEARLHGTQGETLLRVRVDVDGRATRIEIERSSGHRELDRAALAAVRGWRFHPATEGGRPVPSWVVVPVAFRLD